MKIKHLGLLFGLVGVFANGFSGEDKSCKKDADKQMQDCKSLCYAGPHLDEDYALEVMAAAIYQQVAVQASELAVQTTSQSQAGYLIGGQGLEPTETASWGFKVGLGWKTGHDDWKFAARYTWFQATTTTNDLQIAYGGGYFPTGYDSTLLSALNSGRNLSFQNLEAGNKTQLNVVNIYLIRPTLQTALLEISPYFGVDVEVTRRRQTINFTNENPTPAKYISGGYYRVYQNNSYWGVGPMGGIASNWYVGYGIGIYADTYVALTYGQAKSYTQDFSYEFVSTNNYNSTDSNVANTVNQFSPEVNGQLGISWMHNFDDDRGSIGFKVGYEAAYYFQVNKVITNSPAYKVENGSGIGIQGLVLEGILNF